MYIKKYNSTDSSAGLLSDQADKEWPIYRYTERLLNGAEAGYGLDRPEAVLCLKQIREQAGFQPNSIKKLTFNHIVHERKIELAFEGHRFFDLKRWRLSEKVINGVQYHGLYPYLMIHPGNANHLQYTFEKVVPKRLSRFKVFERNNYYTFIPNFALANNPK